MAGIDFDNFFGKVKLGGATDQAPAPEPSAAPAPAAAESIDLAGSTPLGLNSAGQPTVTREQQAARDKDRAEILGRELASAQERLKTGDPRAQGDIEALQREIASAGGAKAAGTGTRRAADVPAGAPAAAPAKAFNFDDYLGPVPGPKPPPAPEPQGLFSRAAAVLAGPGGTMPPSEQRRSKFVGRGSAPTKAPPPAASQSVLDRVPTPEVPGQYTDAEMAQFARDEVSPNKQAENARLGDYVSGAKAPSARPPTMAENMAADLRDATKNPVARGAAAGFFDLGQVGAGAVRMAADVAGADDVSQFAAGASRIGKAISDGSTQGLQGNDKLVADVTNSIMVSAPSMAVGVIGGPALRTLFVQSALAEYNEGRNAGFDPGQSAARAGIMGMAEALGERFGFPQQIKALKGVVKGMPSGEMAKTVGEMIAKEIPGEQLTTAMEFLADKIGPAALRPNATLADYLEAAGETLKVTIAQSAVMGGGPAAIATTRDAFHGANKAIERSTMSVPERAAADAGFGATGVDPKQAAAAAIEASPYGRAKAKGFNVEPPLATDPPETQRTKVEGVFKNAAAAFGVPKKAVDAAMQAADGKPLSELPGFFARFTQGLGKRGLVKTEIDPEVIDAIAHGPVDPTPQQGQQVQQDQPQPAEDYTGLADTTPAPAPEAVQAVENIGRILGADQAQPAPIVGDPINRKWTAFSPESGTLDIPREQMPQIAAEHRGALVNFLNARGVTHEQQEVPATSLKPAQREFSPRKVQDAADYEGGNRSILVSSDGYILDGTHQWLARLDAGAPVDVIRLNAPITDLLRLAHQFPSSTTATGPKSTTSGATSERVGNVAADAVQPAGAGDGRGDQPGGSVGAVGSVPAAPGRVVSLSEAPAAGGGQAAAVADGGRPDAALTPEKAKAQSDLNAALGDLGDLMGKKPAAPAPAAARANEATAAPVPAPAAPPPRTEARGTAKHPKTVMGSRVLASVSEKLGGLDPAWLSEFSHRQETARKGKDGRPVVAWRNPMVTGVGTLFRRGGTQDLQQLAELMEAEGYLPPGSVERDAKAAGEQAKELVRSALNREEPKTTDQQEAEHQAAADAEREAYYAELDAEAAREAEAERQAIMAANDIEPAELDAMNDDDIAFDAPAVFNQDAHIAGMRAMGFTDQEIADDLAQRQGTPAAVGPGQTRQDGPQATPPPDAAGGTAPGNRAEAEQEAADQGLTLSSQTPDELRAKTEREQSALDGERRARAAEQERLRREQDQRDIRARADATVDDFQLGQSAEQQLSGMDDLFAPPREPSAPQPEPEPPNPAEMPDSAPRELSDAEALAQPERFAGRPLEQQVLVGDTGQVAKLKMDAHQAVQAHRERLDALKRLRECLGAAA